MMVAAVAESGAAVAEVGMAVAAAVAGALEMEVMVGAADTGVSPGAASPTLMARLPTAAGPAYGQAPAAGVSPC
jgi:hypothetical protein